MCTEEINVVCTEEMNAVCTEVNAVHIDEMNTVRSKEMNEWNRRNECSVHGKMNGCGVHRRNEYREICFQDSSWGSLSLRQVKLLSIVMAVFPREVPETIYGKTNLQMPGAWKCLCKGSHCTFLWIKGDAMKVFHSAKWISLIWCMTLRNNWSSDGLNSKNG